MSRVFVYGLIDPRLVRYVGKTINGHRRTREHVRSPRRYPHLHVSRWIAQMQREAIAYEVVELEPSDAVGLDDCERWWIAFGRACGWPLTNATDGGEGLKSPSDATRARMRAAALGRVPWNKGKPASSEARASQSAAHRGVPLSAAHKKALLGRNPGDLNPARRTEVREKLRQKALAQHARKRATIGSP